MRKYLFVDFLTKEKKSKKDMYSSKKKKKKIKKKKIKGKFMKEDKKEKIVFNIKLEQDLKDRFLAVAKANDENGSQLIRKFIKDYLIKNSQTKFNF